MTAFPVFLTAGGQPAFTTETQIGDYVITPLLGANEPTALQISAKFMQTRANYVRMAANFPLSYVSGIGTVTAYFEDDVDFEDLGGGVQTWTRLWVTVPSSWMEPGGTLTFTYPAYVASIAFGSIFPVTGITDNTNYYTANSNATGISTLDDIIVDFSYTRQNANYHVTTVEPAQFASSGVNVTFAKVFPGIGAFSGVTGTIRKGNMGRTLAQDIAVDTFIQHDYALADETTAEILLPQIDRFSPVTTAGVATDSLTAGTLPTSTLYNSMVNAGALIPAQRSERRKWRGNVWERTTLLVAAR